MRLWSIFVMYCCVLTTSYASGGQTFPYKAYITADEVYVRSGPGQNYYPTEKLKAGQEVEIYRHDPGGWCAIKPPDGSFTWVSGRYLQGETGALRVPGIATVRGENVAARVGSRFSDIRDVIQVRLNDQEPVEILEKQVDSADSTVWYKIAPPSGEFRWVFGKFVDPDYPVDGVRKPRSGDNAVSQGDLGGSRTVAPATAATVVSSNAHEAVAWPRAETAESAQPKTASLPQQPAEESQPPAESQRQSFAIRTLSPEDFQAEAEQIDVALSVMVAEEPTVWEFGALQRRGQKLLDQAETAVERGRARVLLSKVARFEDIKRRFDKVNLVRSETERTNSQLSSLIPKDPDGRVAGPEDSFDGVGQLTRVVSPKLGSPQYALVDPSGQVRCYVSSAPGVNLRHYVGSVVGVNGTRGYMPEQRAHHVMAQHISVLGSPQLR